METKVLKMDPQLPNEVVLRSAGKMIRDGEIVAFPTETVYGLACRVDQGALEKLDKAKNRPQDKRYTLVISDISELDKYVPRVQTRLKKLINQFWPGPLTIVFEFTDEDLNILKARFDPFVFKTLYKNSNLGIRCPLGKIPQKLLEYAECAVVAPSANLSGQEPAVDGNEVVKQLGGRIELIVDGGKCALKSPSTVVKSSGNNLEILREGAVTREKIDKYSTINILFVCTGNTCRSPMAQWLGKKYLSENLGCSLDQVDKFGYKIVSAGVMAADGVDASLEAVKACERYGIDISSHKSTFLTEEMVHESDIIFVMCQSHLENVIGLYPEAESKISRLADDKDVFDPIGSSQEIYDSCAGFIFENIKKRFGEILT